LDRTLFQAFPFVFYWCILVGVWSLGAGFPLAIYSKIRSEPLPLYPHRYFLAALGAIAVLVIPTEGSLALPVGAVAGVAVWRSFQLMLKWRSLAKPPLLAELWLYRVKRVFLVAAVALIPVAYLRAFLQR
jgi:hypothetical protein